MPDWEALIHQIAEEIMTEHTPARILLVRAKFYDLLSHCIPPTTILKVLHTQHIRAMLTILDFNLSTHFYDR